jgi:hypothetical protein
MFSVLLASTALASSPMCEEVFDEIESTIQSHYVAIALYRTNAPAIADAAAERHAAYRSQASLIDPDDMVGCTRVLQAYVNAYEDPHLFLNAMPSFSDAEAARSRANAPRLPISADRLRLQAVSATGRGPLVGVWAAEDFEVAIIPEGDGGFVAVVVATESEHWSVGDVAAYFDRHGQEWEAIQFRAEDRAPIRTIAHIVNDMILSMPPTDWGRIAPEPSELIGAWSPDNPRAPRFEMISDAVAWLAVPSLSPNHIGESLQAIIDERRDDILGVELLVLDLRGNHGGSASALAPLDPLILTREDSEEYQADAHSPVLLSSPATIGYYQRIVDRMPEGIERTVFADLLRRLQENPGSLVPMLTQAEHIALYNDPRVPADLFEQPEHVAIIVDENVVSAGEAVLLRSRQSRRVTSFGANTGGSIDYQQVLMVTVGEGPLQFALGYPLMADSPLLPVGGFNQAGVPVDIPLAGDQASWPQQILSHYGLH